MGRTKYVAGGVLALSIAIAALTYVGRDVPRRSLEQGPTIVPGDPSRRRHRHPVAGARPSPARRTRPIDPLVRCTDRRCAQRRRVHVPRAARAATRPPHRRRGLVRASAARPRGSRHARARGPGAPCAARRRSLHDPRLHRGAGARHGDLRDRSEPERPRRPRRRRPRARPLRRGRGRLHGARGRAARGVDLARPTLSTGVPARRRGRCRPPRSIRRRCRSGRGFVRGLALVVRRLPRAARTRCRPLRRGRSPLPPGRPDGARLSRRDLRSRECARRAGTHGGGDPPVRAGGGPRSRTGLAGRARRPLHAGRRRAGGLRPLRDGRGDRDLAGREPPALRPSARHSSGRTTTEISSRRSPSWNEASRPVATCTDTTRSPGCSTAWAGTRTRARPATEPSRWTRPTHGCGSTRA